LHCQVFSCQLAVFSPEMAFRELSFTQSVAGSHRPSATDN
jgi:hypothetical protein